MYGCWDWKRRGIMIKEMGSYRDNKKGSKVKIVK